MKEIDSIIGDFLHQDFKVGDLVELLGTSSVGVVIEIFNNSTCRVFFSETNITDKRFGVLTGTINTPVHMLSKVQEIDNV